MNDCDMVCPFGRFNGYKCCGSRGHFGDHGISEGGKVVATWPQATKPKGLDSPIAMRMAFKAARSFSDTAEEYTELKEMLFRTDPDVIAHVRQQMDLTSLGRFDNERLQRGLNLAWDRSGAGPGSVGGYEPERTWMKRAAERASEILDARKRAAEKGSAER